MKPSSCACHYASPDGWKCDQSANGSGLCYWHDPDIDKSHDDIKGKIEAWANSGRPLDGFQLAKAKLKDINLVNHGSKVGFKCRNVDFYRADLTDAHFFGLDLQGSSLMKSKLIDANLHCAQVEDCNFLGADLTRTKLENVNWGRYFKQEKEAYGNLKEKNRKQATVLFQEAEEVCRNIRKECEKQGLFEKAGMFFRKEMRLRRYQMPLMSTKRVISKIVDVFCGYGEEPIRVVTFSIALILSCALIYFILDTTSLSPLYGDVKGVNFYFLEFLNAIYFSVVTFTTLGYGDISPVGVARFVAAAEAFMGSFMMALFVVVFVKKMTR